MRQEERIIGRYKGQKEGPLLICIGAMHGNEPAGVRAIQEMHRMLEIEPITNPEFVFNGNFLGLIGNCKAYKEKKRFLNRDMNRLFTPKNIDRIKNLQHDLLFPEEQEIKELISIIESEIDRINPEKIVLLDLHTTSSRKGIFSIAIDKPESINIAVELHAPVILGMLDGLEGTTLHYFNKETLGLNIVPVTFESGQHDEPLSINRAIAAITNCMRTIGCVLADHVENKHDQLLVEYSRNLPKVVELKEKYLINEEEGFKMKPNFENFQTISKDEILASNKYGEIRSPLDGRILMPLYQEQGEEGFFIVQETQGY